jgi:site-specific recombinase XerD
MEVVRVNALREVDHDGATVRFLPYEEYVAWRDVGLRGQLPDGRPDPAWRGRHGERNAMFADLLLVTGMRLTEASSLLVTELPPPLGGRRAGDLHLPPTITKRARSRTVYVSRRVLQGLHHYLEIERDELVHRRSAAGAYERTDEWTRVASAGRTSVQLAEGSRVQCRELSIESRLRLLRADGTGPSEPLWLWLGENGLPLARSTWQAVFRRANERCARLGLDVEVHPHMLRHSFAVHMLGLLLRQTVKALRLKPGEPLMSRQVKRMLVGDPLRRLQLLLGHRHRETVFIYLDVLDEAQEIVLAALREWDEQAEALGRVRLDDEDEAA